MPDIIETAEKKKARMAQELASAVDPNYNTPRSDGTIYYWSAEEIAERKAEENAPPPPPPLSEMLNSIFESLPVEAQADLSPLKAAVKLEIEQGRIDIARLIIQRAQVPAELEPLRAQMLEMFNDGR